MPYAGNGVLGTGQVSTEPFPDSIEITQEQYQQAIFGMMQGMLVNIDGGFSVEFPLAPEPPTVEPPSPQEVLAQTLVERNQRLVVAANRIAPLQDAVDLGEIEPAEEASLLAWKRYRVALNRIEHQPGFPDRFEWPISPDAAVAEAV